jgi:hypothetical protein
MLEPVAAKPDTVLIPVCQPPIEWATQAVIVPQALRGASDLQLSRSGRSEKGAGIAGGRLGELFTYYPVFVIELESRRVHMTGSTPHPDDAFVLQVARAMTDPGDAQHRATGHRGTYQEFLTRLAQSRTCRGSGHRGDRRGHRTGR